MSFDSGQLSFTNITFILENLVIYGPVVVGIYESKKSFSM